MSIGMTYDEFWFCEPNRVVSYRMADYRRTDRRNQEMWLQGLYVYNAVSVSLNNAFAKKSEQKKYIEEPIRVLPKTGKEQKREAELERKRAIEELNRWEQLFNKDVTKWQQKS